MPGAAETVGPSRLALVILIGLASTAGGAEREPTLGGNSRRLPAIELVTLSGRRIILPDSGSGPGTLLAFAFRRQDQSLVDSWLPWVEQVAATGCGFYEVPLLGPSVPRFLRGVVRAGMRTTVPRQLHRHLAPYYGDIDRIAKALGLLDRTTAHIVLVACDGRVVLQAQGSAEEEAARLLLDSCRALSRADSLR